MAFLFLLAHDPVCARPWQKFPFSGSRAVVIERLIGHGQWRNAGRGGFLLQFGYLAATIRDSATAA